MPVRKVDGLWHYRFQVNGRKHHGPCGLVGSERNRNAAMRIEAAARKAVLEGREDSLKLSVQLFNEASEMFLRWVDGEHREHPETVRRVRVSFASLRPFFGKRPVHSITAGHIEDYKSWRRTEHEVRDVTLRHDLHTLSKFFQYAQYAVKHKWRLDSPVQEVKIPSDADAERTHVLTEAEEMVYFEAAKRYPNLHDLGPVMIRQGCRPQEVMLLAQDAVDIDNAKLSISKGKSKAARRTLKMVPEVAEILSKRIDGGQWVFPGNTRGTHCTKLNNSHGKVLAATGLKFVIYDLRHTFATTMAQRGMDLATLASILGHSSIRSGRGTFTSRKATRTRLCAALPIWRTKTGPKSRRRFSEGFSGSCQHVLAQSAARHCKTPQGE